MESRGGGLEGGRGVDNRKSTRCLKGTDRQKEDRRRRVDKGQTGRRKTEEEGWIRDRQTDRRKTEEEGWIRDRQAEGRQKKKGG